MDLNIATVPAPANAGALLRTYLALEEDQRTPTDEVLITLLSSLKDDEQVIDVRAALAAGGVDERGYPRLALARADWAWCWLSVRGGNVEYQHAPWPRGTAETYFYRDLFVPTGEVYTSGRFATVVPDVPPAHRPRRYKLRRYLVLWEADWQLGPQPPGDPALLRRIGDGTIAAGRLAVVEHVWDPTPLELMVLGLRTP